MPNMLRLTTWSSGRNGHAHVTTIKLTGTVIRKLNKNESTSHRNHYQLQSMEMASSDSVRPIPKLAIVNKVAKEIAPTFDAAQAART
jgi:hypothetical protein